MLLSKYGLHTFLADPAIRKLGPEVHHDLLTSERDHLADPRFFRRSYHVTGVSLGTKATYLLVLTHCDHRGPESEDFDRTREFVDIHPFAVRGIGWCLLLLVVEKQYLHMKVVMLKCTTSI